MRVLGLDPGLRVMGWGIIDSQNGRLRHVAHGVCKTSGTALAPRLLSLHQQLCKIVEEMAPDCAAVEHTFVNVNGAATLKLGQARAIALLVPAAAGLEVAEYAPNQIKKTVVGVGHADKGQVAHMVQSQLPTAGAVTADAADALAIAICHAHHAKFANRLAGAISRAQGAAS